MLIRTGWNGVLIECMQMCPHFSCLFWGGYVCVMHELYDYVFAMQA